MGGVRGALAVVAMLAGCGFSISIGDNTPGDARLDASPIVDTSIDGPKVECPPAFHSLGDSQYIFQTQPGGFRSHHTVCLSQKPGFTHLAIIDSPQEIADLVQAGRLLIGPNPNSRFYVGAIQSPTAPETNEA
jgi:hypothetical protein